jgi:glycosyltransferase involved in cell wall biosynthesis
MQPKVSIIIPCFNSGKFIGEAMHSVDLCDSKEMTEVIIVDDGSTDNDTLVLLQAYRQAGVTVLRQDNGGPAAARNLGIANAKGNYLFFLDSDNKIRKDYISNAVRYMEADNKIGVVYGRPAFFGDAEDIRFHSQAFDMSKILVDNYIDMCALVRKSMLDSIGNFDENRIIIGHEDWELWLRAGWAEWKFYFIDKVSFDYRVRNDSLITQVNGEYKIGLMKQYVYSKHWRIFLTNYVYLLEQNKYYQFDKKRPVRSLIKYASLKLKAKRKS